MGRSQLPVAAFEVSVGQELSGADQGHQDPHADDQAEIREEAGVAFSEDQQRPAGAHSEVGQPAGVLTPSPDSRTGDGRDESRQRTLSQSGQGRYRDRGHPQAVDRTSHAERFTTTPPTEQMMASPAINTETAMPSLCGPRS